MSRTLRLAGGLLLGALVVGRCGGWPAKTASWTKHEHCTWVENPANDGDSFHLKAGRTEYIFRLYFVDTPENNRMFPERVREQAEHFGVSEKVVLEYAEPARVFTRDFLKKGCTVYTKKQDARGRSDMKRYFAIVKVGDKDLAEELVKHGLARVYGAGTTLPDGRSQSKHWAALRAAEKTARGMRRGAWRYHRTLRSPGRGTP